MEESVRTIDRWLLAAGPRTRRAVFALTFLAMAGTSLPNVPQAYIDYSRIPLLARVHQPETYGTDSIADMYAAKVILNDPSDMYTKARLEQTPLEAATWTRAESSPYPPFALLMEAGLYAAGEWTGIGFYGLMLAIACAFLILSARYFARTRWYLFPLLYLNFSYLSDRFVHVQDDTYLLMLLWVVVALWLARAGRASSHLAMAAAIATKLSPLYYARHVTSMRPAMRTAFVAMLCAGFVLPWFIWDNYLYIYSFHQGLKGNIYDSIAAVLVSVPFAIALCYLEAHGVFDREDRIGWALVPVAIFLALKMRVARHLLLVLLVPDKGASRNLIAALGLTLHFLLPRLMPLGSVLYVSVLLLIGVLVYHLREIGWTRVRADLARPWPTIRLMVLSRPDGGRDCPTPD